MKTYDFGMSEAEMREANKVAARVMRSSKFVEALCFICNTPLLPEDFDRSECHTCHTSLLDHGSCGLRYVSQKS